jgi:hypothetical protein
VIIVTDDGYGGDLRLPLAVTIVPRTVVIVCPGVAALEIPGHVPPVGRSTRFRNPAAV